MCIHIYICSLRIYGSLLLDVPGSFRDAGLKASDVLLPSIGLKVPHMIYGYFKFQVRWDQPSLSILVSAQPRLVESAALV